MAWVSFTLEGASNERVTFNTDNISAITECASNNIGGFSRTLIEVRSGKDFYVQAAYDNVIQMISAKQKRNG